MKVLSTSLLIMASICFSAAGQSGSLYVYNYLKDPNAIVLEKAGARWIFSPYKKDSVKVHTRMVSGPDGKYIFRLNKKLGYDTLKSTTGEKLGVVSLLKKTWLTFTTMEGTVYSFKKLNGDQWNYELNGNSVLNCQLKKISGLQTIEFMSSDDSIEGLHALILLSQIYGVDRIAIKKQNGVTWGLLLGLAVMRAVVSSQSQ